MDGSNVEGGRIVVFRICSSIHGGQGQVHQNLLPLVVKIRNSFLIEKDKIFTISHLADDMGHVPHSLFFCYRLRDTPYAVSSQRPSFGLELVHHSLHRFPTWL